MNVTHSQSSSRTEIKPDLCSLFSRLHQRREKLFFEVRIRVCVSKKQHSLHQISQQYLGCYQVQSIQKILMLVAYYPGQQKNRLLSVLYYSLWQSLLHNIAIKLTQTSLLYISCLKKYSAILLRKSLHPDSFSYDPDCSSSIKSSKSVKAHLTVI